MKVKKRYFKVALALILVLVVPWACQSPVDEQPVEEPGTKRRVVSAGDIPGVVNKLQVKLGLPAGVDQFSTAGGAEGGTQQLKINWDEILQIVDSTGRETYTFAIEDEDGSVATFYNLILQLNADKQAYQPFLLKYEMDEEFVPVYLSTGTLEGFSGRLTKIVLNGNLGIDRRGTANRGTGLDVDGAVCPSGSVSFDSGGGSGGGGWSTDPPDIADPDPVTQVKCTVYADVTDWYQADGTYMGRDYHSIWVECEDVVNSSADDDPCAPLSGEIGILDIYDASAWENEICKTAAFSNNACVLAIWNKMNELKVGYETLRNFTVSDPKAKFCLDLKKLEGDRNAVTRYTSSSAGDEITLFLNSDKLGRSKLAIANTILHEMIHAELFSMIVEAGGYDHFREYASNYQGDDPFKTIWSYYETHGNYIADKQPGWQHEYMADYYITYLSNGLKSLAPDLLSSRFKDYWVGSGFYLNNGDYVSWNWDEFYVSLAWNGLKETSKWDGLEETQREKIDMYAKQLKELEVSSSKCN